MGLGLLSWCREILVLRVLEQLCRTVLSFISSGDIIIMVSAHFLSPLEFYSRTASALL